MTKTQYLAQLDNKLRVLPYDERQDALEYYDSYLSDAADETAAIAQLGSPGEVAAMILANYVAKEPTYAGRAAPHKGGMKSAWVIILALFAVPIGLPLVIALAATAFALFIALFATVFAVGVSGVAVLAAGAATLVVTPFVMANDMGFGLITGGTALASLGLGIIFIKNTALLMQGFPWIARFVGKSILRRERHGRPTV